jgi:hypothetical protein
MTGEGGKQDHKQAIGGTMPRSGQVVTTLNRNGVVRVRGENPKFSGTPYCVYLGMGKSGTPLRFGVPDSHKEGDYFYATVDRKEGSFDIHLKAQKLRNQKVTIEWWAIPSVAIRSTTPPTPTPFGPIGLTSIRFKARDYPGRYVHEVTGIGREFIQRLTKHRIRSLATLASADVKRIARILGVSEVRAIGFIYEARVLLTKMKTGK